MVERKTLATNLSKRLGLAKNSFRSSFFIEIVAQIDLPQISTNHYEHYRELSRGWLPTRLKLAS